MPVLLTLIYQLLVSKLQLMLWMMALSLSTESVPVIMACASDISVELHTFLSVMLDHDSTCMSAFDPFRMSGLTRPFMIAF